MLKNSLITKQIAKHFYVDYKPFYFWEFSINFNKIPYKFNCQLMRLAIISFSEKH